MMRGISGTATLQFNGGKASLVNVRSSGTLDFAVFTSTWKGQTSDHNCEPNINMSYDMRDDSLKHLVKVETKQNILRYLVVFRQENVSFGFNKKNNFSWWCVIQIGNMLPWDTSSSTSLSNSERTHLFTRTSSSCRFNQCNFLVLYVQKILRILPSHGT